MMITKNFNPVDHRDSNGEYIPVSVEGLGVGLVRDLELFVRAGSAFFLVKPKNLDLSPSLMSRFWGKFPYLYIHQKDKDIFFKTLENNLEKIVKDSRYAVREKASLLSDYAVDIVDRMLKDPSSRTAIKAAENYAQRSVEFMASHKHAFIHIVDLSSHDHYTYAHSVGVSAYAIALAQAMGKYSKEQVSHIGLSGLLHDLGKSQVPVEILNKPTALTEEEWAIMKKHPTTGAELIRKHTHLDPIVALGAEAHHEDLRGLGYPKGLIASQLDTSVQIISVSDAFSALTTNRSYSKSKDSVTALKLMQENINKKFDPIIFERFVKMFLDPTKKQESSEEAA